MTQVQRRNFLAAAIVVAAAPRIALAQPRSVRIGYLAPRQRSIFLPPILKRLAELGYVQDKNFTLEYRSADGAVDRFPALARELIDAKCDLVFAAGALQPARALIDANARIPVVFLAIDYDPVRAGIVPNLRKPGGNVTGLALLTPELATKHIEILREVPPAPQRFLVFSDPFNKELLEAVQSAARRQRVEIVNVNFTALPYDFESAFERGKKAGVDALLLLSSPVFLDQRETIYDLAMKQRLRVSVTSAAWWTELGWLVSYGANVDKTYARAADIAAAILRGKKAGDIPVEQPTEFVLAINLKTAKSLGIKIPRALLMRADQVIEW